MNVRYHVGKRLWHISNALTHCLLIATKANQKNRPFGLLLSSLMVFCQVLLIVYSMGYFVTQLSLY